MLGDFKRFYRAMRLKAANGNMNAEEPIVPVPIPQSGAQVKALLEKTFNGSFDFKIKAFENDIVIMAFIDGLVDKALIDSSVVQPILAVMGELKAAEPKGKNTTFLRNKLASMCDLKLMEDFNECVISIMSGSTLLFIDGDTKAIDICMQKWEKRAVEDPQTDTVVRGPREGFTETLNTNTMLIRRRIKDSNLVFELVRIGRQTKTNVVFCYIKGTANEDIVNEVRKRLNNIKTSAILESGSIEEFIEDSPSSIFPTVYNSERPDSVVDKLIQGRVAILTDCTPFVLIVPNLFIDYLRFSDDFANRWLYSISANFVRTVAFFITTMTPAFYVAILCFHDDVLPFKLMMTIYSQAEAIPFPPFVEMLLLILMFELIKESGLRMPRALGQTVSIVGALIIGQAAVQAGIVSIPAVIVIAITAVSGYIINKLDNTILIVRLMLLIAANILGILGIVLVEIALLAYMCSLKSFGVPYLSPIAPLSGQDVKYVFVRMPIWSIFEKPETITRKYIKNIQNAEKK
jgi:spore germination protein KA